MPRQRQLGLPHHRVCHPSPQPTSPSRLYSCWESTAPITRFLFLLHLLSCASGGREWGGHGASGSRQDDSVCRITVCAAHPPSPHLRPVCAFGGGARPPSPTFSFPPPAHFHAFHAHRGAGSGGAMVHQGPDKTSRSAASPCVPPLGATGCGVIGLQCHRPYSLQLTTVLVPLPASVRTAAVPVQGCRRRLSSTRWIGWSS